MQITQTNLPGVLLIEPRVFDDDRGHFFETFNERTFRELTGVDARFVQDNQSRSAKHVLRGLHYQIRQPQGKLVRVLNGRVFDVSVDLRRSSATFGQWTGITLSSDDKRSIWIPAGFAHGFLTLSDSADVFYKTTDFYAPEHERTIAWNDPDVGVDWPLSAEPILSAKDRAGLALAAAETF
jgi:dTDP-4-dehydrorhamnose 3,5-epimerase